LNLFCFSRKRPAAVNGASAFFHRQAYEPYKGDIAFDEEEPGGLFEITIGQSRAGLPKFLLAKKLR
jgi:hypothetical protein